MSDISINLDPTLLGQPAYGDLVVLNNDLVLTSDANPAGTNNILQDILQRLRFFSGEWFMDNTQGVPWFQQILIKNPDQATIDAILQNIILGTPGVTQLTAYQFTPNFSRRLMNVSFRCMTTSGVVNYNGVVAPVTGGT